MEALVILEMESIVIVFCVLTALALVSGFLMLWKVPLALKKEQQLSFGKTVSIIIPARNEENRLPKLLKSLKEQSVYNIEIIVVDDDSKDQTVEIAKGYGAQVIQRASSEEDIGKSAACWRGAQKSDGDWLLFLDADTCFEDQFSLQHLLDTYQTVGGDGILSFQPYHKITHLYENMSAVFNIILMAGMNTFTPIGDKLKTAGSFGPCILCTSEEYFSVGGHKEIQGAIMDDLALGELFAKKDFPVRCYSGKETISFQMYPEGMKTLVEGWTKSFGTAAQSTHPIVTLMISSWISGSFFSMIALIGALSTTHYSLLVATSLLCILYLTQFYWLARRVGNFKFYALVFYPFQFLFFVGLFVWSLILTKVFHRVKWRGRNIEV